MAHATWMPLPGPWSQVTYRDLSKQILTSPEKTWICNGILGRLGDDDINWIELQGEDMLSMLCCQNDITIRYKVAKGTVSGWMKRAKQNLPLFQQGMGPPPAISSGRIREIANDLI